MNVAISYPALLANKKEPADDFELVHLGWSGTSGCHSPPGCAYGSKTASDSGGGHRSFAWNRLVLDTGLALLQNG
jgi:hypothetical protein